MTTPTQTLTCLAIDTAGPVCSAAVQHEGRRVERQSHEARAHARHVLAVVDEVLAAAGIGLDDVNTLAFGEGPGGLTGVRVSASVVQAFALATGARVAAVSNLHALALRLAAGTPRGTRLLVAHEAGAGAVCTQSYTVLDGGRIAIRDDRQVVAPGDIEWPDGPLCVAGSGSGRLTIPDGAAWYLGEASFASAADLVAAVDAGIARIVEPEHAQPVYVRHPVDATITL
ncbi:MAG: tRNA (adenosine(37)-N6)-threonylcarbamoyltransferase complex dimerization subunit type 1 TsaB [Pseudomonadota bacterium]